MIRASIFHNEMCYNKGKIDIKTGLKRKRILLTKLWIICSLYNRFEANKNVLEKKKNYYIRRKIYKKIRTRRNTKQLESKIKKNIYTTLENVLSDLEKKMNQHSLIEFDEDIQNIKSIIAALPDKEKLLFNYDMGYKFSKSNEKFAQYFSEGHFTKKMI